MDHIGEVHRTEIDLHGIAGRIRDRRKQLGLSQRALALRVRIRPSRLSKIERGLSVPKLTECLRLSGTLELDLDWLVKGTGEECTTSPLPTVGKLAALASPEEVAGLERLFKLLVLGYQAEALRCAGSGGAAGCRGRMAT